MTYLRRFQRFGDPSDLDLAADSLEYALRMMPKYDHRRAACLAGMNVVLAERFVLAGDTTGSP
ncbi:hypothetical protein [Actinoplanes sp. G11-F43]|uniref:hypothetical protein n=1 Tax=Actinoplanes sp. G11-F43 TaxID=3424130 RepID=UPI003D34CCE0